MARTLRLTENEITVIRAALNVLEREISDEVQVYGRSLREIEVRRLGVISKLKREIPAPKKAVKPPPTDP